MCTLKVANQEDKVGKKAEFTTREDDHRTLSDIDQWFYLFPAEDNHLHHRDNALTPPSSSSLMSSSDREKEMSAIVSALTHVVAGNVPPHQFVGGGEATSIPLPPPGTRGGERWRKVAAEAKQSRELIL
ncbi:Ethylene-responsive transcription factor ABR1 [Raphanus sativus]|nr:Ethylene-responsive transcription factor ABR1 [Raphanus sativus]